MPYLSSFYALLLVPPQTTVFGATLNAKLRGDTLNAQWPFFSCFLGVFFDLKIVSDVIVLKNMNGDIGQSRLSVKMRVFFVS